jgi:uncharacterized protein YgiM (DUF1202 family)
MVDTSWGDKAKTYYYDAESVSNAEGVTKVWVKVVHPNVDPEEIDEGLKGIFIDHDTYLVAIKCASKEFTFLEAHRYMYRCKEQESLKGPVWEKARAKVFESDGKVFSRGICYGNPSYRGIGIGVWRKFDGSDSSVRISMLFKAICIDRGLAPQDASLDNLNRLAMQEKRKRNEIEQEERRKNEIASFPSFQSAIEKLIGNQIKGRLSAPSTVRGLPSRMERIGSSPDEKWMYIVTKEGIKYFIIPDSIRERVYGLKLECSIREDIYKDGVDYFVFGCEIDCEEKTVYVALRVHKTGRYTQYENENLGKWERYKDNSPLDLIVSKIKERGAYNNSRELKKAEGITETLPLKSMIKESEQKTTTLQEKTGTSVSVKKIVTVTWTSATIRSGADNTSSLVTNVKRGDKLTVIREYGQWLNVQLEDGKEGWISNGVVKLVAETEAKEEQPEKNVSNEVGQIPRIERIKEFKKAEESSAQQKQTESKDADIKSVNPEQALQTVLKCNWCERYKDYQPDQRGRYITYRWAVKSIDCREAFPIYELYMRRLTKEVIEQTNLEELQSTYQRWKESKDLNVVAALREATAINGVVDQWTKFIDEFIRSSYFKVEELRSKAIDGSAEDLSKIKIAYWKAKFIDIPDELHIQLMGAFIHRKCSPTSSTIKATPSAGLARIIEEVKVAEEKRKQEAIMKQELAKRQEEIAAKKAKEKADAEFAMAHPDVSTTAGVAGNLPSNKTPKTHAALSFGGTWWHNKDGFGDLKWGTDIRTLLREKDSLGKTVKRDGNSEYTRTGDGLRYYFYNGKFYGVAMLTYMPAQKMYTDLVEDYGLPTRTGGGLGYQTAEWNVGNTRVFLKGGSVGFTAYWMYMPIASKAADSLLQQSK